MSARSKFLIYNKTVINEADSCTKIKTKLNSWLTNPNLLFRNGRPAMLNYGNISGNLQRKQERGYFCERSEDDVFM